MGEPKLKDVKTALKICQEIKIGGQCPNSCPLLAACQMGCGGAPRMILDCIQQLEAQNDTIMQSFQRLKKVCVAQGTTIQQLEAQNDTIMQSFQRLKKVCVAQGTTIQQLEAKVPRWISVEERLPEAGKAVLILARWGNAGMIIPGWVGHFKTREGETGWVSPHDSLAGKKITHWMPLPEPTEEVQTDG